MERFVEGKVRAGQFASASDVVMGALGLLKCEEELSASDLKELRDEISVGLAESRRGESRPLDIQRIRDEIRTGRAAQDHR